MLKLLQKSLPVLKTTQELVRCPQHQTVWNLFSPGDRTITTVRLLQSWDLESFREEAFLPQIPATLPAQASTSPIATKKWFTQDSSSNCNNDYELLQTPRLDESFWSKYADLNVPLEITHAVAENSEETGFNRIDGPLGILFAHLEAKNDGVGIAKHSVYLAQHDLRDLPQELQDDLPMPLLVSNAGKGDLYSSSLWLGRSPTYTPLHRDPNPNLLMQLAGTKEVRLFHPEIGNAIFEYVQRLIDSQNPETSPRTPHIGSASFRGEEMMKGAERRILHDLIWTGVSDVNENGKILEHAHCATLYSGQALFIPKGWWHSVKGVGDGVTASANWWFR